MQKKITLHGRKEPALENKQHTTWRFNNPLFNDFLCWCLGSFQFSLLWTALLCTSSLTSTKSILGKATHPTATAIYSPCASTFSPLPLAAHWGNFFPPIWNIFFLKITLAIFRYCWKHKNITHVYGNLKYILRQVVFLFCFVCLFKWNQIAQFYIKNNIQLEIISFSVNQLNECTDRLFRLCGKSV